ncbi:hypothetical protein JW766_05055 [Candidatus Dojkabacteria bacterium]|nr:hypothetical protein [Candidatus Dojkabacteria bacterium]
MTQFISFLGKNKRSIFYAFSTGFGLTFALELLKDYGGDEFWMGVSLTSVVLILEIYLNWRFATRILRQIDLPSINTYNLWGHFLNHITLPLLLFFSLAGFIYFNSDDLVRLIAIIALVFINIILFINIRSYYQDEFKIDVSTRYIYDVIKLIISFFGINLILHVKVLLQLDLWLMACCVCFLLLILGGLLIYRKAQVNIYTIAYVIISSFLIAVVFMLLNVFGFILLGINVISFLLFYFSLSILHHRIERSLTLNVFLEYVMFFIIALLLFAGLS